MPMARMPISSISVTSPFHRSPLPSNGAMIEIHGHGGKGIDWTEGCIALTNNDMDNLFNIVKVGTPVTIVGSMQSLRQILRN